MPLHLVAPRRHAEKQFHQCLIKHWASTVLCLVSKSHPKGAALSTIDRPTPLLFVIANVRAGAQPSGSALCIYVFGCTCVMLRAVCVCVFVCVTSSCSLQYIESPDVEKEVKRLLSTDAEAVSVRILFMASSLAAVRQ